MSQAPSVISIVKHFILLGDFKPFNGVIWSLVQEMRISLIFPLIMYLVLKYGWKKNVSFAILGSSLYFVIYYVSLKTINYDMSKSSINFFSTLHYLSFFIIGALLAKYKNYLSSIYTSLNWFNKTLLMVTGFLLYLYSHLFLPNVSIFHIDVFDDWVTSIGCSIFIVASLNSELFLNILKFKPIHFTGKISYSLYLFHMTILLIILNIFIGKLPVWLILLMVFITSIFISTILYYLIEVPSIKLGKTLIRSGAKTNKESTIEHIAT